VKDGCTADEEVEEMTELESYKSELERYKTH